MPARIHGVNLRLPQGRNHHRAGDLQMHRNSITLFAILTAACSSGAPVEPVSHDHHAAESLRMVSAQSPEVNSGLAEIRRVTAKFHDYQKAIEAGYTAWSPNPFVTGSTCPTSSEGNMGYHLVNVPLRGGAANPAAGDAEVHLLEPEMLLYEKQ